MASTRVEGFKPSLSGFRFCNAFRQGPVCRISIPLLGEFPVGNAAGGLCGGMVYTVRDYFEAGVSPPARAEPPEEGHPLFRYIAERLIHSFDIPTGVLKYYRWMVLPQEDHLLVRGVTWKTVHEEWPRIRACIDNGSPACLGLVTVHSLNPVDLGHCHQVLAYGYDLSETGDLALRIYDPNFPSSDDLVLSMNLVEPAAGSPIRYSTGMPVRGFFLTRYRAANVRAKLRL
jgi:hypothetical protein